MTAPVKCDLCAGTTQTLIYEVNDFPIVKCNSCGLVFVGRRPRPEELVALYDSSYYEDAERVGYSSYTAAEGRKRHHDRTLLDELERYTTPGVLVEIGCAYGYFLDEARTRGWQVRGVEPSAHAVRYARNKLALDVTEGTLTDLACEPGSLDAIVLWDVIEHLPNPRATLRTAAEWLRPGGLVALSTGDFGSLSARLHGRDWSLMTPPWHQYYFSRATLRRLLDVCGFDVERIRGDGSVAVDPGSQRPRIPGSAAAVLEHPIVMRVARKLGAGSIMFAFARKRGS